MFWYWYHTHLSTQYCDGLRRPFIIYDPEDPHADLYDVDDDSTSILTLSDYAPDATLINGVGRWSEDPSHDLAIVNIIQGIQYCIQMLNVGCDTAFTFSIEIDSVNHVPYTGSHGNPSVGTLGFEGSINSAIL
ncbi:hypothetical protein ARMGADRAFT_1132909 [Armillaria gallica]|uniref:Plastocyanin-like domain-containing protein n=1 Tax=Armillaria gallica TaxID=47427 RepID=A0A2H3CMW9_ARMGA|nr:hypothetical protein ARMGADRAFT_1132909 [Armillaria gallica]